MFGRFLRSEAVAAFGARLLGAYLGFALRTTRWTVEGREHFEPFATGGAVVVAFWHQTLPLMPALWNRARTANPAREAAVLVSRHRDGRFIGAVMQRFGVSLVHGSTARRGTDKGGAASMRALLASLGRGCAVVMTPDGPRGPNRVAALGAVQLASLSAAPLLPTSGWTTRRLTLKSWDRMIVPLPFGRGALVCLPPIPVAPDGAEAALPLMEQALTRAADRARALCGEPCQS